MFLKQLFVTFLLGICMTVRLYAADTEAPPPPRISVGKAGLQLESPDGEFKLRIRGYIQADGRFFLDDNPAAVDTFVIRRARPIFEGTIHKYFEFRIMPDFGGGQTVLQDAYIDAKLSPAFRIRFGKSKTPFGLERLQSATDLALIERSLATNLVPNRDIGISVLGDLFGDKISYAVGIFNGVVDLGSADLDSPGGDKDFAARIFARLLDGLNAGVAVTAGNQDGSPAAPNLPSYRTQGQVVWFRYRSGLAADSSTVADGSRIRFSPQLTFYKGPFGLLAEYVTSSQEVVHGTDQENIRNTAWNLTAHYILSGEKAGFRGVSPENRFDLDSNEKGAWEIAFRYSVLSIDEDAFPIFADPAVSSSEAINRAAGVNWHLNENVKFSLNYDHTTFEDDVIETEKLISTRLQIEW